MILVFAVVLSACAGEKPTPTPKPSASGVQNIVPVRGGSINLSIPEGISANPLKAETVEEVALMALVYEKPVSIDASGRVSPNLFENWTYSEENGVWTCSVRKSVLWHGTDEVLTANDIGFTIDTLKAMGAADSIYAPKMARIESYNVVDDNTIEIKAATGKSCFLLYSLDFPVVSKNHYDGGDDNTITPGTGPYKITTFNSNAQVTLSVNENWWKTQPYITSITARCMSDNDTAIAAYNMKQLDAVYTGKLNSSQYREAGVTNLQEVITRQYEFLLTNMNNAALAKKAVRQAIAYALDRQDIVSRVYFYHAVPTDMPLVPGNYLYDTKHEGYEHDAMRSVQLFREAGYYDRDGDGLLENKSGEDLKLTLLVNNDNANPMRREAAQRIADQLKAVGVTVEIDVRSNDQYRTLIQAGDFDIALAGCYVSMEPDWQELFKTGGNSNYGGFESEELDALIDAVAEADESGIAAAFSALQEKYLDELPQIGLFFRTRTFVYSDRIKNVGTIGDPEIYTGIEQWFVPEV